jgi:Ca2+-binding EF-hand superfamily protein
MNLKQSTLLAATLGLFATGAIANEIIGSETETTEATPVFEELDRNTDGAITSDEAENTWLASSFQVVDTDQDGNVTKVEYEVAAKS